MMLKSDVVLNPSDGMVQTMAQVFHQPFSRLKVQFDLSMVILSCMIALVVKGYIIGVGVGTIVNALCIGYCVSLYDKIWVKMR